MKSFWEGVKLGFTTLFSNPIGYLTNPVKATTDVYRSQLVETGLDPIEINARLEEYHATGGVLTDVGEAYGSVTSGIGSAIKSVGGLVNFIGKNLPMVLLFAVVVFAAYTVFMAKRVKIG
jgi:hypothetical protein